MLVNLWGKMVLCAFFVQKHKMNDGKACPSACFYLINYWTDFNGIWYWLFTLKDARINFWAYQSVITTISHESQTALTFFYERIIIQIFKIWSFTTSENSVWYKYLRKIIPKTVKCDIQLALQYYTMTCK